MVVDDAADNATEDKVPDKVDRCQLGRPLLAREAQVEDDQGDTDQELKDRHLETMKIEHDAMLPAGGRAVPWSVISSSDPRQWLPEHR